jgi:hypothetical protein
MDFSNPPIEESTYLAVEGRNDQGLMLALARSLNFGSVYVQDMNGNQGWSQALAAVSRDDGFRSNVRAVGLVQDADQNRQAAWERCADALQAANLPVPEAELSLASNEQITTSILILPTEREEGALEELVLPSIPTDRRPHVDAYFEAMASMDPFLHPEKALVEIYMAGMRNSPPSVHVAFGKGCFDLNHSTFDAARAFVHGLVTASAT